MRVFLAVLRKDRIEYVRSRKGVICVLTIFICCVVVLGMTLLLPSVVKRLSATSVILSGDTSLSDFMRRFFPNDLSGSMGILAADIGVFYGIVVILLSHKTAPDELTSARAVLPFCAGHSRITLLLSKQIIYSFLMAVPVYTFYMLYYMVASGYLAENYQVKDAFINGLILALSIFTIVNITICLSMIYKARYGVLIFMIGMIAAAPDAFSFFTIGKYLPTYLLTLTYRSNTDHMQLIAPLISAASILLILEGHVLIKENTINLDDRG